MPLCRSLATLVEKLPMLGMMKMVSKVDPSVAWDERSQPPMPWLFLGRSILPEGGEERRGACFSRGGGVTTACSSGGWWTDKLSSGGRKSIKRSTSALNVARAGSFVYV